MKKNKQLIIKETYEEPDKNYLMKQSKTQNASLSTKTKKKILNLSFFFDRTEDGQK